MAMIREICNALAVFLTVVAFIPYVRSIFRGQTKPHPFSWLVWGLATTIVYFAQSSDGAGIGAWSTGLSGILSLWVAYLAFRRSAMLSVTRSDWFFFLAALSSLPFWFATQNPFWAVLILSIVDTLGFGPTFRKAYWKPFEEDLTLYILTVVRNLFSIISLENYSWTTILFPGVVAFTCAVFVGMVWVRQKSAQ